MGLVLWASAALAAFLIARLIPSGRQRRWRDELFVALPAGVLAGMLATALDFGGWRELDWRAGLFAFLLSFAGVALVRLVRLTPKA
ncbi:MAG: hypothetical protein ABI718_03715 [Acidobacteriota bacterium]